MKWFKHLSGSRNNPDIYSLREHYGGEGVDIFWSTIELFAERYEGNEPTISGSKGYFRDQIPGYSIRKILKVWEFFSENSRETWQFFLKNQDEVITLSIPYLKQLTDEYSRKLRTNSGHKSGQTPDTTPEQEAEEKKKEKKKRTEEKKQKKVTRPPIKSEVYEEIVAHLNELTGSEFRHYDPEIRHVIKLKIHRGYSIEDFKKVIENKCRDWLGDEKMEKHLVPSTLFGRKMDQYLNERGGKRSSMTSGKEIGTDGKPKLVH